MNERNLSAILAIINIAACFIFLIDGLSERSILIPRKIVKKSVERSASRNSSHYSQILTDEENHRYNVSISTFQAIKTNDQVLVKNSFIFNRPNILVFKEGVSTSQEKIGIMNASVIGVFLCGVSILLSLFALLKPIFFKKEFYGFMAYLGTWIIIIVAAFYFFFQP